MTRRAGLVLAILALTLLAPGLAAGSGPVVVSVATTRIGLAPGIRVPVSVVLRAPGGRLSGLVGARLVSHRRVVALAGSRRAPARTRATIRFTARVPRTAAVGVYRLEACLRAPGRRPVCRTARRRIAIASTRRPKGHPLTVVPTLDAARAASATIGPAGGSLSTTAADGSRAVLTIPAGALGTATPITMTPVTALTGHPQNPGLLTGVDIEPDGTRLAVPARLELQPARTTKPIQRVVLTAPASGVGTRPDLFTDAGTGARIDLLHFSSYELVFVSTTDFAGQRRLFDWREYPPTTVDIESMRAELTRLTQLERQRQLLGQATDESRAELNAAIEGALQVYYDRVVLPDLAQARKRCDVAPVAIATALGWERQVQLMAFSDVFSEQEDEIQDQIRGIAAAALACVERRCLVNNFPEAAVDLIALHRYFALLGLNPPVSLQEQLDRCLRFRVEIESEIGFRRNQLFTTGSYRVVVAGEQDTGPPDILAGYIPLGDLTLRYTETTGGLSSAAPSPLCSGTIAETISSTTPGTMRLQLDPLVIQETKGSYATRIVLEGGDPQSVGAGPFETYTDDWSGATCTSGVPDASHLPDNWWAKIFSYAHRDERTGGDPYPIAIARFHRGTNPIFLQKQYVREADLPDGFGGVLAHYYEATTIRIRHVPIPAP